MAKFINTRRAVSELEDLIRNAGEKLILVSPYLKVSKDFRELLTYRNGKDRVTTVIFGKQELKPEEMHFLQSLRFLSLRFNESLHAKCYLTDDKMIITSLNLYEFSMANNKEMGVLIDRNDPADAQLFADALKEVEFIRETSSEFRFAAPQVPTPSATSSSGGGSTPQKTPEVTLIDRFGIKKTDLKPEMIEARRTYPRAYESWSEEEEAVVEELARRRMGSEQIGKVLGRQPSAIERRLKDLGWL